MELQNIEIGQFVIDPNVIAGFIIALVILIVGYFLGAIIGKIVKKIIVRTQLQKWIEKTGRIKALGGLEPPAVVGALVKWWIFSLAIFIAADYIELLTVSNFLQDVAAWIPQLLAGILIVLAGLILADFAADSIGSAKKLKGIKIISPIVKVLIIIYFVTIAFQVIGIRVGLAENTLLIVVAGIVLALSLALGIGFGFAFRKHAEKILTNIEKKM